MDWGVRGRKGVEVRSWLRLELFGNRGGGGCVSAFVLCIYKEVKDTCTGFV